jgi:NAD(P)-dependent dehydrogenase (short-subunit alcohol dehydrogenase family)
MTDYPLPNNACGLSGQVALVTGTTSGLGWRFARVLATAGARVALTGRRTERLDELAELIQKDGGECAPFRLDMTDMNDVVEVVGRAEEALGTVTILVNNAGIPDAQRAHEMSQELIDAVFDTNLRGPYVLSCEVARRLIAAKIPGRIVNISSVGAFTREEGRHCIRSPRRASCG